MESLWKLSKILKVMDFISAVLTTKKSTWESPKIPGVKNFLAYSIHMHTYTDTQTYICVYICKTKSFLNRRKLKQHRLENIMNFYIQHKIDKQKHCLKIPGWYFYYFLSNSNYLIDWITYTNKTSKWIATTVLGMGWPGKICQTNQEIWSMNR